MDKNVYLRIDVLPIRQIIEIYSLSNLLSAEI